MTIKMYINCFRFYLKFQSCLNVVEATYIRLLIETSFASLARNHICVVARSDWYARHTYMAYINMY